MFSIASSATALFSVSLVTNLYDTFTAYQETTPKKVGNLVRDLESKLPSLSGQAHTELKDRITAIKSSCKEKNVKANFARAGIQVSKSAASSVAGPVGLALAIYATHETEKQIENNNNEVIVKAKKIAGRRVGQRVKSKSETSAVNEAVKAGVSSAASSAALSSSVVINTISWGKSLFFGS